MSALKVRVTVTRSVEYVAEIDIDADAYEEWGGDGTPADLEEFLNAGRDLEEIIYDVMAKGEEELQSDEYISHAEAVQS